MIRVRKMLACAATVLTGLAAVAAPAAAADPVPAYIPPAAGWLTTVNYFRAMAKLPPVTENTTLSQGAYNHSCYMLLNGISHDEIPGNPGYTTSGDNAGNKGNVAVSSVFDSSSRYFVELWMTGPFHTIGVLRHNLRTVGWGRCANANTSPWKSAATLNVIDGLDSTKVRPSSPILFPANGTTTGLTRFVTESPNPVTMCGWTGGAGLPLVAMMPEAVTTASVSLTGPSGPLQTCRLSSGNTTGVASAILASENAVVVMPRTELQPGTYTATVTTNARTVTWSFTVDPAATTGIMPIPEVTAVGPQSAFEPVAPFRYADSRTPLRITKVLAGVPKQIAVAGIAGIPGDVSALSANFTVTGPSNGGYLTVYNCTNPRPTAATLNFGRNETVGNAAVVSLTGGSLCVFSPVDTHLVIDVNGWFRASATDRITAIDQVPIVDTQRDIGASGRRPAGSVLELRVRSANSVLPSAATAAVLSVAAVNPTTAGYVTMYPCDAPRPTVSNVNGSPGITSQNSAIVPIGSDDRICIYTYQEMDLRIDLTGYFAADGIAALTPTTPTRLIDTRDTLRPEMNFGLGGVPLPANTVRSVALAGQRGIPVGTQALTLNLAVVPGTSAGTVTLFACGAPGNVVTSTFAASKVTAVSIHLRLPSTGDLCVKSSVATHLVIDVNSYWF